MLNQSQKDRNYKAVWTYISKINGHEQNQQELFRSIHVDVEFNNGISSQILYGNEVAITYNNVWGEYKVCVYGLNKLYPYQESSTNFQLFSINSKYELKIQLNPNTTVTLSQPR